MMDVQSIIAVIGAITSGVVAILSAIKVNSAKLAVDHNILRDSILSLQDFTFDKDQVSYFIDFIENEDPEFSENEFKAKLEGLLNLEIAPYVKTAITLIIKLFSSVALDGVYALLICYAITYRMIDNDEQ